jgi:hypothetical protein
MNSSKMEEKGKGISLRKKRTVKPKISAPKQISGPLPPGAKDPNETLNRRAGMAAGLPTVPRPRERPQNGDRTADLVKRRYSTRFNTPQDYNAGAPPMPSLPKMPSQFAVQPPIQEDGPSRGHRLQVDVKALADPKLQPEKCKLYHCDYCLLPLTEFL